MAHQNGTANSLIDLVAAWRAFGETCGWTTDKTGSATGYNGLWFTHNAAGDYFSVAAIDADNLGIHGNTGFNGSAAFDAQPGTSADNSARSYTPKHRGGVQTNGLTGPYVRYDFFGSGSYLHAVVEITAGVFRHFGIGHLDQTDATTGGAYAHGTSVGTSTNPTADQTGYVYACFPHDAAGYGAWNVGNTTYMTWGATVVRADGVDGGPSPRWWPCFAGYDIPTYLGGNYKGACGIGLGRGAYTNTTSTVTYNRHPSRTSVHFGRSDIGNQNLLEPSPTYIYGAGSGFYNLGYVPDWRVLSMDGLAPRQLITLGDDQWMIFPAIQQFATGVTTLHSQQLAYAYRVTDG